MHHVLHIMTKKQSQPIIVYVSICAYPYYPFELYHELWTKIWCAGLEDCRLGRLACASHERCIETGGGYSCVDGSIILATTTTQQQVITTTQMPTTTTTQLKANHAASNVAITPYPLLQISITGSSDRCRSGFAWNRFTQECEGGCEYKLKNLISIWQNEKVDVNVNWSI